MPSETGASTSTSVEQSQNDEVDIKAVKLLGEGKRHLLVGDAPTAVISLQEACEILAEKYGELADQCVESYYNYGNALLELGRMESGVLGNALDGVPEGPATDDEEDEKKEGKKDDKKDDAKQKQKQIEDANKLKENERKKVILDVKEALETNYQKCMQKEGAKVDGKAAPQVNGVDTAKANGVGGEKAAAKGEKVGDKKDKQGKPAKDDCKDAAKDCAKDGTKKDVKDTCTGTTDMDDDGDDDVESGDDGTGNEGTGETGDENKEVNPDDIPNFQLAWEMLEISRVIYRRKAKENMLKVAQVHFKLGELGLETEQYAQSLEDFSKCLEIQKANLEPESRLIAGSHYNLGLAYALDNKYDKAMEQFRQAKKTIEERIVKLNEDIADEEKEKEEGYEESIKKMKQEITELQELVPDILAKIEDSKESKAQLPAGETTTGFDKPGTTSAGPIQSVQLKRKTNTDPATSIAHLVKRKKTDVTNGTAVDKTGAKKTKKDGSGDAGQVNGTDATKGETKEGTAMETA